MKGVASWASYSNNKPWEGRWTLPYQICGMVKSRTGPRRHQRPRAKQEKKESLLLARAGLSSYLYRLCITCVTLSLLGVVSAPPHYRGVAVCIDLTTTAIRPLGQDGVSSPCRYGLPSSQRVPWASSPTPMPNPSSSLAPTPAARSGTFLLVLLLTVRAGSHIGDLPPVVCCGSGRDWCTLFHSLGLWRVDGAE